MNSKREKFNKSHEKVKELRESGKLNEARQNYISLLNTFDIKDVDYVDYIVVMSELGDIERELNLISESKKTYLQALNLLCKAPSIVPEYEIQKEKYHLFSNLGLIECSETEKIIDKIVEYNKFRALIDETLRYYKICEQIVVKMIMEDKDKHEENDDEKTIDWWKTQFIALIVNLCTALSEEAFEFEDKHLMDLMIRLIEKAERFYDLCKNRTKEKVKSLLSKSFYFKAICLKFLKRKKESEEYFIKDYNHCKEKNLFEDLKKTKEELFKFYLENFKFNEAKQIFKTSDHTAYVNEKEKEFRNLMRRVEEMKNKVKRFENISADDLEEILFDLHEMKCPEKAIEFNHFMRQSSQFKSNLDFRYWLEYYAVEYHIKLENYNEAMKFLKEAIKIKGNEPNEKAWCSLLNALILEKTETDKNKISQAFQKCVQDSNFQEDKDCKIECEKEFKKFKFNEQRTKIKITYDMNLLDSLLEFMNAQKLKRVEAKKNQNRMEIEEDFVEMIPESMEEEIYRPQKKLIKPLNEVEGYIENCKIMSQEPLEVLKELLKNPEHIELEKLIFFNTEQLIALLNSTSKITNLDLTNFVMNTTYLKRIKDTENSNIFKKIKINMINASIIQDHEKIEFYDELYGLIKSNQFLEYLMISNAYESEKIMKIVHSKDIHCLESLTVLKLKECQIEDKDLIFFSLHTCLPQLKKLSLFGNKLKGRTLEVLTSLKSLETLSLSSNPLNEIVLHKTFDSLKKISLNNLSDLIHSDAHETFICLLVNCGTIKMKHCQQVCLEILIKLIENAMNLEAELTSLKHLNLFGSQLKGDSIFQTLKRYNQRSPNLSSIDLRNCRIILGEGSENIRKELEEFESTFNYQKNPFEREMENPENNKALKMENLRFTNENNARRFNNFSIN